MRADGKAASGDRTTPDHDKKIIRTLADWVSRPITGRQKGAIMMTAMLLMAALAGASARAEPSGTTTGDSGVPGEASETARSVPASGSTPLPDRSVGIAVALAALLGSVFVMTRYR
jgi:hypothetical protein